MRDLIDLIVSNELLLILLAIGVLQGLASLGAKAARKAVEQQRRAQQAAEQAAQRGPERGAHGRASGQPAPAPAPRRVRRNPEEIAAEIRRMMGLEEPPREAPKREAPKPVVVELRPAPTASEPAPTRQIMITEVGPRPRASYDAPVAAPQPLHSALPSARRRARPKPAAPRHRPTGLVDLSDPAAAFVALEVLGPPRALREWS